MNKNNMSQGTSPGNTMNAKINVKYNHLFKNGENDFPELVKKTIDFFSSYDLWFKLSRNAEARSCKDAARKRNRLGHTGIPLEDELKSFFGKFVNDRGTQQYVVLHCRGNQTLDFSKISNVLNTNNEIKRLTSEEMARLFHLNYGLVNPFVLDTLFLSTPILQVFDKSLLKNRGLPYTMMTNAGALTWGVEFKCPQLIETIHHKVVETIIQDGELTITKPRNQIIGIITGNAPESGILLWKRINKRIRDQSGYTFYGDISFPKVIVESIPDMRLSMELDLREKETWHAIDSSVVSLCKQGASIICIACNTAQYFTPEIRKITSQYKTRYISAQEVTFNYLIKNKIDEFAFLGVKYVTDFSKKWSAFKNLSKFKVETLEEKRIKEIHYLAYKVKQEGISGAGINKLRDLLDSSTKSRNIVIALTELSILLDVQKKRSKRGRRYIDTLDLLAIAVADEYMNSTQILI